MPIPDRDYYSARAKEERAAAERADGCKARAAHLNLAAAYEQAAGAQSPREDEEQEQKERS